MDAIDWLGTQGVSLIRLRWDGQFVSVVTTGGQAASADRVHWQMMTRDEPEARLVFSLDLIREKVNNSLRTMEDLPRTPTWDRAYKDIVTRAKWLERRPPTDHCQSAWYRGSDRRQLLPRLVRDIAEMEGIKKAPDSGRLGSLPIPNGAS